MDKFLGLITQLLIYLSIDKSTRTITYYSEPYHDKP